MKSDKSMKSSKKRMMCFPDAFWIYVVDLALCAQTGQVAPVCQLDLGKSCRAVLQPDGLETCWMDWEPAGCDGKDSPRLSSGVSSC